MYQEQKYKNFNGTGVYNEVNYDITTASVKKTKVYRFP